MGLQSVPEQQLLGYQSWTGVAMLSAAKKIASFIFISPN